MALPAHTSVAGRIAHYSYLAFCGLVLLFLIAPILVIIPLSFNAAPYFTFSRDMLQLDPSAFSLRWYRDIIQNGMNDPNAPFGWGYLVDSWNNAQWIHSLKNSFVIAVATTLLSMLLGTLAALGLTSPNMPARGLVMSALISPMVVPLVITSAGMYFVFSQLGLTGTFAGLIIAHTVLGTPFVLITVAATLEGFDRNLIRAGLSLGASPVRVFFKVIVPLILPGVISGGVFAFATSFDEVVTVIFLADYDQRTVPRQMWAGIREQISPTILAMATILVFLSLGLLTAVELLRRRSDRMRGVAA
ncbi:polyamine ABC transporter permease [Shinella sp. SUS2]|jgi:putative spermidine/putrescine transport system permease protein|uniref:ABC transporter permease n=1 Tax=unclassified Shinella TaxID=2643062 RepID=UPI0003C56D9B|nr:MULTISPECIES: ABC transporter permease [unclassified Shinella]MCA0339159.1 ABC transporter permease [Pseudomonadota bacterium]EYR81941.1 ABC-type spermidine/putrescine transport system permease component II [Shinella sp. DD12]KNY17987.1 polyamine ABC transporter permease [Shinella sp. SUS2]KOC75620.1 polyamine ABC transporter permease [Shinella sp. GWS1]MDG4670548.1 ABC transporter permease [Shinella sp. 838]